ELGGTMANVQMPRLSDSMETGKILRWLKKEGEEVKKGEPLVEIESDKANIEVEAYASGKLSKIVVPEGGSAPIGAVIAEVGAAGQAALSAIRRPAAPENGERQRVSPVARRLAEEHRVDLRQVQGSGPGGRITKEDVEAAAQGGQRQPTTAPTAAPAREER